MVGITAEAPHNCSDERGEIQISTQFEMCVLTDILEAGSGEVPGRKGQ